MENLHDSEALTNSEAKLTTKLRNQQSIADIGRECTALHHVFGADIYRKGNFHLIEYDTILYSTSSTLVFQNVNTGYKEYLLSIDDNGIGCVAVHPSRKFIAVGGKGYQPNLYIYSYPEKKVVKVLSGGAERGYACLNFSSEGDKLASVSISPDFMLTIWDWEEEQMGLHAKAFGQDVINVKFSLDDPGRLTTSGTGHVRFWKMASTFTGLKLQGSIGKFGKIDLSDIEAFVEFPDGKVVSGTETGSLLVWEGNFIKCRLTRSNGKLCHDGLITYLSLDRIEKCLISAAEDGYIRWWSYSEIDNAEVDADISMDFDIKPIAELFLGFGVGVRSLVDSGNVKGNKRLFVISDTKGNITSFSFAPAEKAVDGELILCNTIKSLQSIQIKKLTDPNSDSEIVVDDLETFFIEKKVFSKFHSSPISGMDTCHSDHLVVTSSIDGTIRCNDYVNRNEVAFRKFNTSATCLKWLPKSLDSTGKMIAVGFGDGVVRILGLGLNAINGDDEIKNDENEDGMLLLESNKHFSLLRKLVFKPHNAAVTDISFSPDGTMLATAGNDGIIFFFSCVPIVDKPPVTVVWNPIRFVTLCPNPDLFAGSNKNPVSCKNISWNMNAENILVCCTDGILREIQLTKLKGLIKNYNQAEIVSYEEQFPIHEVVTRVPIVNSTFKSASTASLPKVEDGNTPVTQSESPSKISQSDPTSQSISYSNPVRVNVALYTINRGSPQGMISGSSINQRNYMLEGMLDKEIPIGELPSGLYSLDGRDQIKNPLPTSFRYSWSQSYFISGCSDGVVTIRPSSYLEVFSRYPGHNGGTGNGVTTAMTSFDDSFILSAGSDSTLIVRRVRLDFMQSTASSLFKDLDAGVFGSMITKPIPTIIPPEPSYLTFVSCYNPSTLQLSELSLFKATATATTTAMEYKPVLNEIIPEISEQEDLPPEAYSIQDNAKKLEEKAKQIAADELKAKVRGYIEALQSDYENIIRENSSLPEAARLTPDELLVDKEYLDILEQQGKEMLEEVHKECRYEAEKASALLKKIRSRMANGLLMEEITLSAFEFNSTKSNTRTIKSIVKSLRLKELDSNVKEILDEVHLSIKTQELKEAQMRTNETSQRKANDAIDQILSRVYGDDGNILEKRLNVDDLTEEIAKLTMPDDQVIQADSSVNVRRIKRLERKEQLRKHLLQKPNEDEDDIRDLNAIKLAEKTIGDYKLKCADDYEVPEEQRINTTKKLRQMVLLEESMFKMRLKFNERFLSLRNLKRQIIYSIKRDNKRIREIDELLGQSELSNNLYEPQLQPEEFPDDDNEVTASELLKYENDRENNTWEKVNPPKHSIITGNKLEIKRSLKTGLYEIIKKNNDNDNDEMKFENFLSDEKLKDYIPERTESLKYYEVNPCILKAFIKDPQSIESKRIYKLENTIPVLKRIKTAVKTRVIESTIDPTNVEVLAIKQKLEFERYMILNNIETYIHSFGEAISNLRVDRHEITADLKLAELKLLTLYQEYHLLETFESRDNSLQQKQIRIKNEETEITTLTNDNKMKLDSKEVEMQTWNTKLLSITDEFKSILPESHSYFDNLSKIFRKKMKKNNGKDDDNDEEEDDDDDEDGDDDEDEVEDICPPGCDLLLFERVIDLRSKKVETEEVTSEIQKCLDDYKKTIDRLKAREKQIKKDIQQTDIEVQQFQLQKQAALNQIAVVVPLKASQLYMFDTSGSLTGPILTDDKKIENDLNLELNENIERLKDHTRRCLVSNIDLKSHVLLSKSDLIRLQERISELLIEIDTAKEDFHKLHRERGLLTKELDKQIKDIVIWNDKCHELQMLKFGKIIDLDDLERDADRTKEKEAEKILQIDIQNFNYSSNKLLKSIHTLEEELSEVTRRNTKLLNEVAELSESKAHISKELNLPHHVSYTSKFDNFREAEEQKRIAAYIKFQTTEIESLKIELNMLKRKEAPPLSLINPPSIPLKTLNSNTGGLVLPPIPNIKK